LSDSQNRSSQLFAAVAEIANSTGEDEQMLHRFMTLTQVPELRTETGNPELGVADIEVFIPVDVLWQAEEMIKEMRFLKSAGFSTTALSTKLYKLLKPYVVNEKDRLLMPKAS